jgi:hypothetical protein
MYGLGGATAADYTGSFGYRIGGVEKGAVPGTGLITINSTDTTFELYRAIATDSLSEASEGIAFNVAQTTSSIGLVDSWWVQSTVDLQDARGTGTMAQPRTITTIAPTITGMEGSTATATFNVSRDGASNDPLDYASSQVRVSMYGLGGATPADYTTGELLWHEGTTPGGWSTVPSNGLITIQNTATVFQLGMAIKTDSIAETSEGIAFNVAQTTSSIGLVDSWFVQRTVDLADVTSIYTTVTGAIGPDHFTATGNPDMFVIPHGTSKAFADGATGLPGIAGDTGAFNSGELFDTITGFTAGTDKIDLTNTVTSLVVKGTAATEEALLTALNAPGFNVFLGAGVVGYYTVTPAGWPANVYFLVDANGDNGWYPGVDTFIKIVGGGSVTTADFV